MLEKVWINDRAYEIINVRYQKNFVYAKLSGIDNLSQTEKFKGCIVKIPEELALPLDDDEYYLRDLYDLKVYDGDEFIGKITDVIQNHKDDIYVVDNKIFIPAIKNFILDVDIRNKTMHVKLIEGMRELNA